MMNAWWHCRLLINMSLIASNRMNSSKLTCQYIRLVIWFEHSMSNYPSLILPHSFFIFSMKKDRIRVKVTFIQSHVSFMVSTLLPSWVKFFFALICNVFLPLTVVAKNVLIIHWFSLLFSWWIPLLLDEDSTWSISFFELSGWFRFPPFLNLSFLFHLCLSYFFGRLSFEGLCSTLFSHFQDFLFMSLQRTS